MYNTNLIKRSFIRQSDEHTCGIACLGMIFNYSGNARLVNQLNDVAVGPEGLSMYDMMTIANWYGYSAKCVEMELPFLRTIDKPCILHAQNELGEYHYHVCYGSRKSGDSFQYLMADPARHVHWISEQELDKLWFSKAALYFDDLKEDLSAFRDASWAWILRLGAFPQGLYIIIPALTLCAASFGIAMSWVLQKGIMNSYFMKSTVIIPVVILLLLISLFRSAFAFLRQYLMIRLNIAVNRKLMSTFIRSLFNERTTVRRDITSYSLKHLYRDVQKIQNAVSEMIGTVLSEGSLIIVLMSMMTFFLPWTAFVNAVYFLLIGIITANNLDGNSYHIAQLTGLSASTEKLLIKDIGQLRYTGYARGQTFHISNQDLLTKQTQTVAVKVSARTFTNEALGAVNVIIVLVISLWQMQQENIDYPTFMLVVILSYLCSSIVPKICNSVTAIADGINSGTQYRSMLASVGEGQSDTTP
ncbi:cysteine peptidase family C39 domain-containing protein [Mucilaginibacter terrae]|uniref:ABC-type bacteriocin/lantibiotic exporter with double-glycine peptidase domain n=1 Tax=Mucilaginibacter terrae TaxID=1955052 RepID=A0ABU3GNA7_9SPHI|nr:cysteine peptidase family C39 domain-containing protein [Mucilaginibacter terrae]MDT3401263.1 ABC-type bacteriocin/lantibiotic exporter with double-glycine peptidase domain [Mucilaginibacter terrae]